MSKTANTAAMIAYHEGEIAIETKRWNHIKKNGASDPLWPDGCNMNLVRNHIIYHLMEIDKLKAQPTQLSIFDTSPGVPSQAIMRDKRIPPKVPNSFMATDRKLRIPYTGVD